MNFQCTPRIPPLRVLVINPFVPSTQMFIIKILTGFIFGPDQTVDLTLLVYANETEKAEEFRAELETVSYGCVNQIHISSNLPKIYDADVFCFLTNFKNPNEFNKESFAADDQFDVLYLLLKIANSLGESHVKKDVKKSKRVAGVNNKNQEKEPKLERKPIIVADGIITLEILTCMAKNLPTDILFCSTPIEALSDIVLGNFLKVKTHDLNVKCIWAANHDVFHLEYARPLVSYKNEDYEKKSGQSILMVPCGRLNLDYVQFNETWMKKNFAKEIRDLSLKNPYGQIYKTSEFCLILRTIWEGRRSKKPVRINAGVVSDGSLGTHKGYPYVLPIDICGEYFKVSEQYKGDAQLQLEIQRMNKVVRQVRSELLPFCNKFLEENILKLKFMPLYEQSLSTFSFSKMSQENFMY